MEININEILKPVRDHVKEIKNTNQATTVARLCFELTLAVKGVEVITKELKLSECNCEALREEHQEAHQKAFDDYKAKLRLTMSDSDYKHFIGDE